VIETAGKLPDGGGADAAVKPVGQQ
jgi:hypothetical protein